VADACQDSDAPSGSMACGKFRGWLSEYNLFKKNVAAFSETLKILSKE
jgi:hypothetical protein